LSLNTRFGSSVQKTPKSCSWPRFRTAVTAELMDSWCQPAVLEKSSTLNCSAKAARAPKSARTRTSNRVSFMGEVKYGSDVSAPARLRHGKIARYRVRLFHEHRDETRSLEPRGLRPRFDPFCCTRRT